MKTVVVADMLKEASQLAKKEQEEGNDDASHATKMLGTMAIAAMAKTTEKCRKDTADLLLACVHAFKESGFDCDAEADTYPGLADKVRLDIRDILLNDSGRGFNPTVSLGAGRSQNAPTNKDLNQLLEQLGVKLRRQTESNDDNTEEREFNVEIESDQIH